MADDKHILNYEHKKQELLSTLYVLVAPELGQKVNAHLLVPSRFCCQVKQLWLGLTVPNLDTSNRIGLDTLPAFNHFKRNYINFMIKFMIKLFSIFFVLGHFTCNIHKRRHWRASVRLNWMIIEYMKRSRARVPIEGQCVLLGWLHVKSPRKKWPIFFFDFWLEKSKVLVIFRNKNYFFDLFWWFLTCLLNFVGNLKFC